MRIRAAGAQALHNNPLLCARMIFRGDSRRHQRCGRAAVWRVARGVTLGRSLADLLTLASEQTYRSENVSMIWRTCAGPFDQRNFAALVDVSRRTARGHLYQKTGEELLTHRSERRAARKSAGDPSDRMSPQRLTL